MDDILRSLSNPEFQDLPVKRTFVPATHTHLVNAVCAASDTVSSHFLLQRSAPEVKEMEAEIHHQLSRTIDRKIHFDCVECPHKQTDFFKEHVTFDANQRWTLRAKCKLSTCNQNGRGSVVELDMGVMHTMMRELEQRRDNEVIGSW